MALVLEPRFLFDASVGPATTKPLTDNARDTADHTTPAAQTSAEATADTTTHAAEAKTAPPAAVSGTPTPAERQTPGQPQDAQPSTTATQPSSVLFVDTRVSGWKTLAASVGTDTKVVVIDGSTDGIAQVTKALEGLRNVDRLDFLTYGQPGQIELGAGVVDTGSLQANAGQIAAWRDHLSDNAQIQFWGCDVGAGSTGNSFVSDLHALTGVAVAASIDTTGAAALGGNWTLERTAGDATPSIPFSTAAVANFMTVLDAPVPTVTLSGLPSEILLGGTFSATVTFDNTAITGIGYGPYIDLFVPNNTLDKVTLESANLLGHDLAISSVVYSTSVAGHLGVLGALHPLLLDATGAPQFVNAPPTAVEGGRMYVLQLPFGSFTPDQSAANVTLNFTIDKTSVVTNQHAGQLMTMGALGGFAYGADALNNPSVDPGIRGTAGNTPTESTPANGGVSVSASVVLAKAAAQVITTPGEGETPTGPDYPAHLQITITPAPATDGNPITGTVSTITLPDTVQYTGGPITITGASGATATFVPGSAAQGGSVQVSIPNFEAPGPIVLDIPIFVPETAANGSPILDPDTGAPVQITFAAASFDNGTWMPWAGSADEGLPYQVSGTLSATASFTARSLAVQVSAFDTTSNSATNFRPGDTVVFTTKFEISDYFNFNNLLMQSLLDDGFTIDPTVAPVLTLTPAAGGATTTISLGAISGSTTTVNGQLVATSGSNADWSFVRDNAGTGATTVNLTPSAAIAAALGSSRLEPGITGTLTVSAHVLDKYTNSHIDPFTGTGGSITERDSVTGSVSATATVVTALGLPTTLPPSEITDNSNVDLVIPEGSARIFVAAINGVVVNSFQPGETFNVQPGDTITYAITYNLVTGDYRSLSEAAFMPLPIINVADPLANGSSVTAFVEDTAATTANPLPGAGKYFLYNPSPGMSVASANVNAASNGITFDLGHRDDTTNAAGQRATVLFSFVVTTAPFADGLSLTAQGEASLTNASGTGAPIIDLSGITLNEPNLTQSARTGIASLVDNGLGAKSASYTAELTGAAGDPSTVYVPAGSSGSPFVANDPGGPRTVGDLQDLNVAGADGSDTVRVIITVANTGASSAGAYDVTVSSALPTGYTIADVSNITATRGGGLPVTLEANAAYGTGTMAGLFTTNGVMLEDPSSTAETPHPTLYGVADIAHRNVLTISYDLKLKPDQSAGTVLTAVGNIVNYTNIFDGVAQGNGFVVNGVPVGGSAADLVNNATVTTTAPTMPKTFGPSDTPQNDNVDPSYPNATVVVGNTRPVTITVTLPEGSLNNGSGHVLVTELLPPNEIFRNLVSITPGPGVTLTGAGGATVSGSTVTFDLGSQVRNSNADAPGTVTITYNAYFADGSNTDGTTFTSTANLVYSGAPVAPAVVTFVQHDPMLNAALSDDAGGIAFTGKTITYTYTIANNGLVQSQTTESELDIPTGLAYVPGTLQLVSQSGTPISSGSVDESNGAGGILVVHPGTIAAGGVLTYRFQATVAADLAAGTDLTVAAPASDSTGLSIALPQPPAAAREYHFSVSDPLRVRTFTSALYISGEANGTTVVSAAAPVTDANVVIGDITRLHGQALLPEGTNTNVVLDFTLPAGLSPFLSDGTVKLALISDLGHITSSTLDPAGNTAGLQVAQGTTAIDPTTFTPTYILPASAIDSTSVPGHLRISLGTVTDNGVSPLPNYAVLEFNGVVVNTLANQAGVVLSPTLVVASDAFTTAASRVNETIVEPNVDMQKVVTAIDSGAGSVDYRITLTNTGNATAYAVTVSDPLPTNVGSIVGLASTGGATGLVVTPGGGNVFTATMTLAAGQSQVFTYTMVVADPGAPVPATTVTETFQSLNPTITSAFGSTVGPVGSGSGARDGSSLPTVGGLNDYWRQVTNSLATASGQVWQALGDTPETFDPVLHTALGGITVTHTSAGPDGVFGTADDLHQTVATGALGRWFFGLIPNGTFRITLPPSGSAGLPASETLVFNAFGTLTTLPAQASATAGGNVVAGMNFAYELPDTAPTVANWATGVQGILPSEVVYLTTTFAPTGGDVELDKLVGSGRGYSYEGVVLTVQRYDGSGNATPNAADVFGGDSQLVFSGNNVVLNGAAIGTFLQVGGTLSITLGAGTGKSTVNGVLTHLTYSNPTTGTVVPSITIGATISDANFNNVALATGFTGRQGTGGVMTSAPVYSVFALAPGGQYQVTFIEPNNTPAAASAVALGTGRLDLSGGQLEQVVVALTTGFVAGEDFLTFSNDGTSMGNIAGSYDAATGRMVLTSAGATATAQQWQNAAGAILYYNASDRPTTATRDVFYAFTVTTGSTPVGGVLGRIVVAASDDSPILDPSVPVTLAGATEDGLNLPSGAVGTLVTALANAANVADTDGANAHDGSAPGPTGIAIVGADTTRGNWWYSLDNGASWALFAGPSLPAMSTGHALHLVADANTRIYFQPTVPNFNGALPVALSYRAWDRSDGVTNGTLSALPPGPLGSGTLTDAAAYSSAVAQIPQAVAAVNDAPVTTGTAGLVEPEDTISPTPATVANLFGGNFSDTADQQQSAQNPTGSVANVLAGIAITGNATVPGSGTWRYSLDGGATWTAVASGLSDSNALVLSASARLEFLPAPNFNGVPSVLTVRLIDSSDVVVTGTTTGANLAATTQAIGGVDVTVNGGTTAVSADRVPLSVVVTAVNDAPVASGTTSLPAGLEDTTSPPQTTVLSLFGANFSDAADQQQGPLNPTGSVANTLAGVAITGNLTPAGEGVWRYSTDGGASWVALPQNLSATNALVLSASVRLEFLPAPNFNGAPLALTARLIDSSDEIVTGTTTGADLAATTQAIAGVDVSGANSGGTTAVSAGSVVLSTTVTPVNDAPTAAGDATLRASVVGSPPFSQSVVELFSPSFGDAVDLQRTALNPTGSISDVLAGVVVVGNATPASQGEWRYSQDGGATWTAISTGVSDTAGLALGGNVRLAFFAAPGFIGFPTPLSVRLIDSSHDVPVSGSLTGQDFTGTTLAVGNVDVSGAHNGGITAISADAVPLRTVILPTGPYSLPFIEPNNTPAAGRAVFLPGATPSGPLDQVVLQLGGGFTAGEDVLRFTNDGTTMGNIVAAYDAASGRLVLSSAGGTASPTEWNNALAAISYVNISDQPHTVARSVTYTFFSSGGGTTTLAAGELTVTAANDAPILDPTVDVALANSTEDVVAAPSGAVGTLVSALVNAGNVSDHDGANAHDGSAPGPTGMAVVEADTTRGNWWYSTDNGASWTRFAGPDLAAISAGNALHLVADVNTRIYFQPTVPDFNGAVPVALAYRAWDRSDGVANGALSALPTSPPLSTGTNTASSAYSIAEARVGLVIVPVNDAPVASGVAVITEPEDTTTPSASTVGSLFAATFSDAADQQRSPSNPLGSSANVLAAVAIVDNSTPSSMGTWRYSTDGGATWNTVAANLSDSNALVLSRTVRLEFVPTPDYNGTPSGLTVRLIDSSNVVVTGTTTGMNLLLTRQAIAGVDVTVNGGTTAVSADTVPLSVIVTPVNDAPIASGVTSLPANLEDTTDPSQSTVLGLFGGNFSDTADQQRSLLNPSGSVENVLAGIAITGNATVPGSGTWRYSLDGGATWTAVASGLSDSNALVLSASARLEFLPAPNFNGVPSVLTVRLIDSSDVVVTGTTTGANLAATTQAIGGVDVTVNGGTTAVSADRVPLSVVVTAVNDAPVASGTTSLPANAEDTTSPPQTTVLNLFGGNFSDVADQQRSLLNPTGSVANTLAGVAITGNLTPAGEGVWRYSTDGGATWTALPRNLSASNALVLSASVRLEFLPAPDFNGAPLALTARLIDSSDVIVTGTTTGADLLTGGPQAIAGVDVSGANSGGTTAVSAGSVVLSTTVTPVNDAPTAAGDATLRASVVGLPPRSQSVVDLFEASFGDAVDLQRTALNPTGSISDVLAGVVVVGNTTPASQGEWRYSQDGGATWTSISTGVSDTAGLALGGNVQLAFFAAPGFIGFPTPLSVRLIDSSHDVPVSGSLTGQDFTGTTLAVGNVDVSGAHNGGITAISADAVPLRTVVLPTGPYSLPFIEPNNTPAAGHAVFLPGATPSGPVDQVVLQLAGGFTAGEDVLRFTNDGTTMGNIVAAYDAASGRLVLSSAGGTASPTEWNNALAAISYVNTSDQPHTVARSVTYTFFSSGGGTTTLAAGELTVVAANDAPILDRTVEVALADGAEDVVGPPAGAVGTLVSALANSSNVADRDGANAHDGSAPGPTGIAIVSADTTRGNWWYSLDNGASWTRFAGPDLAAISADNALHLVADVNTRIYFQPTVPDFNGAVPVALAYRAWDRSDGVANGALSALPTSPPLSTGINTASSAYSIALNRVGLVIVPVNDAPVASGTASLGIEPEDTTSPVQGTVLGLFRGNFSDVADQQQSPSNPFGSNANLLAGIAIVGNTTPAAQGIWRYSTDNGATWTTVSADLSTSNALVLSQLVRLEFVPTANFNGIPAPLTVRLIDSSTDVPLVSGVTGRDLVATSRALAGVDLSGGNSGGRTAVSAADVPLTIRVSPVNDAPTAAGSASLPGSTQGRIPPHASVFDLFAKTFADTVDQQRSLSNPFGSVADGFAGIVVVGNATPTSQGVWRYSTDGGATWNDVPTSVSDAKGLLLGSNVHLAFFPAGGFIGTPTPLVVRLVDSSTDVPVTGTLTGAAIAGSTLAIGGVDVSGTHRGGITAVSADAVPLNTSVNAAPSPPSPPTPPIFPPVDPPSFFFQDPRMLNGFLVGGNVYRVMLATQPGTINVSADVFYGSVSPRELTFEASSIGGGPLPPWLFFDSILLRFTGTPPESAVGTLDLRITAKDRAGREAAAEVHVIITQPPRDILPFLRPIEGLNPIIVPPAVPVPAPAAAPESAPAPQSPDSAPPAPPSKEGAPPDKPSPGGAAVPVETRQGAWFQPPGLQPSVEESLAYGLTAQMREQSVAGKVARARALLNALT